MLSLGSTFHHSLALSGALLLALPFTPAQAAKLKEARVSQVVKDVKLLPNQAPPRPANVSDEVRDGTAVRTGTESRAELTFTDATLARLGANTVFSFNEGTRNLDLGGGAMLLRVPKNAGGAKISTAAITAAITGTTIMLEYHPDAYIKFIVLEGTGRIYRNDRVGESVLLHAGQMLILNPKGTGMPDPVDVDLERLLRTSLLINGFRPLPSSDLIAQEIHDQLEKKSEGELINTNLVIFGRGTAVTLLDPTNNAALDQANANEVRQPNESPTPTISPSPTATPTPTISPTPTATPSPTISPTPTPTISPSPTATPTPTISPTPTPSPSASPTPTISPSPTATPTPTISPTPTPSPSASPTPDKYGTPPVITSPNPYVITNGTVINTDPTITTAGVTDAGKIYRDPEQDGTPSTYLFGSTSPFDTSSGFDDHFSDASNAPMTVFKFSSLELSGNPTIVIGAGGATHLALISVGDLFSGTAQATFTYDGLDSLLLASQNGNITLGQNITFQNISTLFVYARGLTSTLTFDSTVTGSTNLVLLSQNNIVFNNERDITETAANGIGLNISLNADQNLTATNGLVLTLDSSDGSADYSDISINVGGDLTAGGEAGVSLLLDNSGGSITNDATLGLTAGGTTNAGQISMTIQNGGGSIGGDASIFVGGGTISVSNMNLTIDGSLGGNFGGAADIVTQANSLAVDSDFTSAINLQGTGTGAATVFNDLLLGSDFTVNNATSFTIANGLSIFDESNSEPGGAITGDASIIVVASNITSGTDFTAELSNTEGGSIGGNASVLVSATGDLSAGSFGTNAAFVPGYYNQILSNTAFNGDPAGTINGNATVQLSAQNVNVSSDLALLIENQAGGVIGGSANVTADVSGVLNVGGYATISIDNDQLSEGGLVHNGRGGIDGSTITGGTINGNATIDVNAGGLYAMSLYSQINNTSGLIGGSASILYSLGTLATQSDATFQIYQPLGNSSGTITIDAGSIDVGGYLTVGVLSDYSRVILNQNVLVHSDGDINVGGDLSVDGNVTAGGDITVGQTLSLPLTMTAGGSITGASIFGHELDAAGDITVRSLVEATPQVFVNILTAGGDINFMDVYDIQSDSTTASGQIGGTPDDITFTASAINTTGPTIPLFHANGDDASSSSTVPNPGNGGNVTVNLSNGGIVIDSSEGTFSAITANGGAFVSNSTAGGDGGHVTLNVSGDVSVTGGNISATTGDLTPTNGALEMGGNGGTVDITTTNGTIDVGSTIVVSSNDPPPATPTPTPPPVVRRSAKGGNIHLTSNRPTGVAVNIQNTGQLLALLDAAAPAGNGGTITILATGASSEVDVKGTVTADEGTIDIEHTGQNGEIYLGGTTDSLNAHADTVKVGALGANGVLTVGSGTLTADSVLKLYAPSSNGEINFIANVTLGSGSSTILAGGTITIQPRVVVNIAGNGGPAQVYTNNPNYSGFGGNNEGNGTFGGNGANNPQPLASAPPFQPGGR